MSGPIKLFEIDFFNNNNYNIIHFNLNNTEIERIPYKNWNTNRTIFKKDLLKSLNITEEYFGINGLDYNENISKFPIGKKSHGKSRGTVNRL